MTRAQLQDCVVRNYREIAVTRKTLKDQNLSAEDREALLCAMDDLKDAGRGYREALKVAR